MKSFSGRWVIISLILVSAGVGAYLYPVFKESGNYKAQVLSQMQKEFLEYNLQQQGRQKLMVVQYNGSEYFVDFTENWKFELHKKLLVVTPPALQPEIPAADLAEVHKAASEKISELLKAWIMITSHTLKDFNHEVRF